MKRFAAALLLALVPVAAEAVQDTCTFTGAVTWSAIGTTSGGSVSCVGGDTLLANDDIIVIGSGTTTITGDITQGSTALVGITVQSGATLTASATGSALRTITLGPAGLTCSVGSTCSFDGRFLTFGQASPALLTAPSTTATFRLGEIAGCGSGPDCTKARFTFTADVYNDASGAAVGDQFLDESVAAISTGDLLCFWNPSGDVLAYPHDAPSCYEITNDPSNVDPYAIEIDLRQGARDPGSFRPLSLRSIHTGTLAAAVVNGQRTISLPTGTLPVGTNDLIGRWIRFSDGTNPEPFAYRIQSSTDGGAGADTVTLVDTEGVKVRGGATSYSGTFWIDYGWTAGDPFVVVRPVKLASATTAASAAEASDSATVFSGTTTLTGVHFERVGGSGLEFDGASAVVSDASWLFVEDADNGTSAGSTLRVDFAASSQNLTIRNSTFTGGDLAFAANQTTHGLISSTASMGTVTLTDVLFRNLGDDCLVVGNTTTGRVVMNRVRCQYAGGTNTSTDCIDHSTASSKTVYDANGIECIDTSSIGTSAGSFVNLGSAGTTTGLATLNDALVMGMRGTLQSSGTLPAVLTCNRLWHLGSVTEATGANGPGLCQHTNGAVLREIDGAGTSNIKIADNGVYTFRNVLVNGFRSAQQNVLQLAGSTTTAVENVALVNLRSTNAAPWAFNLAAAASGAVLDRISIVYPSDIAGTSEQPNYGIVFADATPPDRVTNVLVAGVRKAGSFAMGAGSGAYYTGVMTKSGYCLFGNRQDVDAVIGAGNLPADTYRGVPLTLFDAMRGRASPIGTALACGATRSAGIPRPSWVTAILGTGKGEAFGALIGGGGGGLPRAF